MINYLSLLINQTNMQMHGSTNKSPIKLSAAENKLTWWFVYEWEKPSKKKPHWVILRSPFSRIHYYHNKLLQVKESQYLIPTYSWTLTSITNWTCFVMTISHFQCKTPSTRLTNCANASMKLDHQLEKDVYCKVLQFIQTMNVRF